jgi:hypothetical protein
MLGLRPIGAAAIGAAIVLAAPTMPAGVVEAMAGTTTIQANASSTGAATVTPGAGGPKAVNETAANSTQANTSSTAAATVTPATYVPVTVNETAASSTQANTSGTGAATVTPGNAQTGTSNIAVPASRTAYFVGHPRVAVFTDTGPVKLTKGINDQVYIVGDFTKPLADGATTATSVEIVNASTNLSILEGPALQGSLMVAKIGALDPAGGQFTFRVTCANGEIIDGTVLLTALDDRSHVFGKDPDDRRFFALDVSADLALSGNTTIASVQTPNATGVTALSVPAIQGGKAILLIGGLDLTDGATNSCELVMTLASTEVIHRTVYFSRQDH